LSGDKGTSSGCPFGSWKRSRKSAVKTITIVSEKVASAEILHPI
jgi:hypothetical protein